MARRNSSSYGRFVQSENYYENFFVTGFITCTQERANSTNAFTTKNLDFIGKKRQHKIMKTF